MTEYFDRLAQTWDQDPSKLERSAATAEQCKTVSMHETKSLLDIGGGTGLLSIYLRDCFDSILIADTSGEMLRVAQEKISAAGVTNIKTFALTDDISEIPETFSAIITLMTLHHIVDLDRFIRTAATRLDDRGTLMIADLYREDGAFHQHVANYQGHNGFEIEALSQKLIAADFAVTRVSRYFEISKENRTGEQQRYPLFFLVAQKR